MNSSKIKTTAFKRITAIFLILAIATIFSVSCAKNKDIEIESDVHTLEDNIESISPESTPQALVTEFRLTILHTNDLHGIVSNTPKYSTIVKQVREEVENVLLLDGGDLYRRGPYERFNGAAETEIFNAMKYDATVFGNNDYPQNDRELYDISEHTILQNSEFAVLCGNVTIDGDYIDGFDPYLIKEIQGINIALIGVTSLKPRDRGYDLTKRALFADPVLTLNKLVEETKELSEIQIVLSHAGFDTDKLMRGVSAVIGGDSHTKLSQPFVINSADGKIPVVQAGGEQDNYLGRLDLIFKMEDDRWVLDEFDGFLYSLTDVAPDVEIQNIIDKYNNMLNPSITNELSPAA